MVKKALALSFLVVLFLTFVGVISAEGGSCSLDASYDGGITKVSGTISNNTSDGYDVIYVNGDEWFGAPAQVNGSISGTTEDYNESGEYTVELKLAGGGSCSDSFTIGGGGGSDDTQRQQFTGYWCWQVLFDPTTNVSLNSDTGELAIWGGTMGEGHNIVRLVWAEGADFVPTTDFDGNWYAPHVVDLSNPGNFQVQVMSNMRNDVCNLVLYYVTQDGHAYLGSGPEVQENVSLPVVEVPEVSAEPVGVETTNVSTVEAGSLTANGLTLERRADGFWYITWGTPEFRFIGICAENAWFSADGRSVEYNGGVTSIYGKHALPECQEGANQLPPNA